jgi:hypothetical protein
LVLKCRISGCSDVAAAAALDSLCFGELLVHTGASILLIDSADSVLLYSHLQVVESVDSHSVATALLSLLHQPWC